MKKLNIWGMALSFLSFYSCTKDLQVPANDFQVIVPKNEYRVGDTVNFQFSGSAANITFYSGESGFNYENRNRTSVSGSKSELSFATVYGGGGSQPGTLKLLVSNQLDIVNAQNMVDSKWTDITDKAVFATGTASTLSGSIDLTNYALPEKPIYIAFKFVGFQSATTRPGNWVISTFDVKNTLSDGSVSVLTTMATAGWAAFDIKNTATKWVLPTSSRNESYIVGGALNTPDSEDWLVTKPLFVNSVKPDNGMVLQSIGSNSLSNYNYVFTKPGVYNVVFVASNNSIDDEDIVIKRLMVTINP